MAAISVTEANVAYVSGPLAYGPAGESIDVGDIVYLTDSGTWKKAQCDGTAVEAGSNNLGMAICATESSTDLAQYVVVAVTGAVVTMNAALTKGVVYYVGATAGDLVPVGDLVSTNKVSAVAIARTTSQLLIQRVYDANAVLA